MTVCLQCKNNFTWRESRGKRFCSHRCWALYRNSIYGNPMKGENAKLKSSISHEGMHCSSETEIKKGQRISPKTEFKLREHFSPETEFKKNDIRIIGENNTNWHNGASFEEYGKEFKGMREKIRKRDRYRCQECSKHQSKLYDNGGKRYKLIVHHIDYNKKNNTDENLISLCRKCHLPTNHNRDFWTNHFQNKMKEVTHGKPNSELYRSLCFSCKNIGESRIDAENNRGEEDTADTSATEHYQSLQFKLPVLLVQCTGQETTDVLCGDRRSDDESKEARMRSGHNHWSC